MGILPPPACMATATTTPQASKRSMVRTISYLVSLIGMYEGDPYGDEIEGGDEDKNDGLNALVKIGINRIIEPLVCHRLQQRN